MGVHRKPPLVEHDRVQNVCEIPLVVAACPTAAIKPKKVGDMKSIEINNSRCMFCGNCYTMCPALPLADGEGGSADNQAYLLCSNLPAESLSLFSIHCAACKCGCRDDFGSDDPGPDGPGPGRAC